MLAGFALLLTGSFLDSMRPSLLTVLADTFHLPYRLTTAFLVVGYSTSVVATFSLIRLVDRWGPERVAIAVCAIGTLLGFYAQTVQTFEATLVLGVLIAISCSGMGALSNVMVLRGTEPHQRMQYFGLLHMMFGLGSQAGPLVAALVLGSGKPWQWCFLATSLPAFALGLAILFWVKPDPKDRVLYGETKAQRTIEPQFQVMSVAGLVVIIAAAYVTGEVLVSMWLLPYLRAVYGMSVTEGAPYLSGFFWTIAVTRGLCIFVRTDRQEMLLIAGSLIAALGFFALGHMGWILGFSLTGVMGPFFPLVLSRMSRVFPEQAQSLSIRMMAAMQGILIFCNLLAGNLVDVLGAKDTYFLPAVTLSATMVLGWAFLYFGSPRRAPALT